MRLKLSVHSDNLAEEIEASLEIEVPDVPKDQINLYLEHKLKLITNEDQSEKSISQE